MFKRNCVVKYVDNFGVEHAAKVRAESCSKLPTTHTVLVERLNTGPSDLEINMTYGPLAPPPDCPVNVTCITRGQTTMNWLCKRARILDSNQVIDARDAIFKSLI